MDLDLLSDEDMVDGFALVAKLECGEGCNMRAKEDGVALVLPAEAVCDERIFALATNFFIDTFGVAVDCFNAAPALVSLEFGSLFSGVAFIVARL